MSKTETKLFLVRDKKKTVAIFYQVFRKHSYFLNFSPIFQRFVYVSLYLSKRMTSAHWKSNGSNLRAPQKWSKDRYCRYRLSAQETGVIFTSRVWQKVGSILEKSLRPDPGRGFVIVCRLFLGFDFSGLKLWGLIKKSLEHDLWSGANPTKLTCSLFSIITDKLEHL